MIDETTRKAGRALQDVWNTSTGLPPIEFGPGEAERLAGAVIDYARPLILSEAIAGLGPKGLSVVPTGKHDEALAEVAEWRNAYELLREGLNTERGAKVEPRSLIALAGDILTLRGELEQHKKSAPLGWPETVARHEREMKDMHAAVNAHAVELAAAETRVAGLEQTVANTSKQVISLAADKRRLEGELAEACQTGAELALTVDQALHEREAYRRDVAARDARIAELERQLGGFSTAIGFNCGPDRDADGNPLPPLLPDVETLRGWREQVSRSLLIENAVAAVLDPPAEITRERWHSWVAEQAERIQADRARLAEFERQNADLQAANNDYRRSASAANGRFVGMSCRLEELERYTGAVASHATRAAEIVKAMREA